MTKHLTNPKTAFALALLMGLPIALMYFSVALEIGFMETALKSILTNDGDQPTFLGRVFMLGGLFLLPVAIAVSLLPMLWRQPDGKRHFYRANTALAVVLVFLMVPSWGQLLAEIYRCDILGIPNCD